MSIKSGQDALVSGRNPVLGSSLCRILSGIDRSRLFSCGLGWGYKNTQKVFKEMLWSLSSTPKSCLSSWCMDVFSPEPISEDSEDLSSGSCVQTESEQGAGAPTSGKITLLCKPAGVCRLLSHSSGAGLALSPLCLGSHLCVNGEMWKAGLQWTISWVGVESLA